MPNTSNNSGIRDNHRRGNVADFLNAKVQASSRLSVVSAYFTIYAYEALKDKLDHIAHLDFLFGEPRFIGSIDPDRTDSKNALPENVPNGFARRWIYVLFVSRSYSTARCIT